jgi:pimeloyl-ACP methyl ester carboxylesterase
MKTMTKAALAAATLLVPLSGCAAATQTPPAAASATVPAFQPTRFSVVVEGSGPDVILIPGLSTPRAVWDGARAALGGHYRLHLVQLNGFGGTPVGANSDQQILAGTVEELDRYIVANRLQRPAVVGHSLGGLMGMMLAQRAPDRVGRLMVVDALPFIGAMFGPQVTVEAIRPQAEAMRTQMSAPATPEQRQAAAAQVAAGLVKTPAGRELVTRWMMDADPRVSGELVYEGLTTDVREGLARIAAPVTVLYAYDDARLPQAQAASVFEPAYRGAPNVRFEPVGGSAHFIMLDQPERFAEMLRAFLGDAR